VKSTLDLPWMFISKHLLLLLLTVPRRLLSILMNTWRRHKIVSADWHTKAVRGTDTRGRRRSRGPSRSRRGRGRATGTVRAVSPSSTRTSPREQLVARRQLATSAPQSTSVESRDQNSLHYAYTQEASTAVVQITGRHASLIPVSSLQ